jgi:virginiamycin B lyase
MTTRRLRTLGSLALGLVLLSACATTPTSRPLAVRTSELPGRLSLAGYSVAPPTGPWAVLPVVGPEFLPAAMKSGLHPAFPMEVTAGQVFFLRQAETSVYAAVRTFDAREVTDRSPDAFRAWLEAEYRKSMPRFHLVDLRVATDSSRGGSCARFESLEEDREVPNRPGVLHYVATHGVSCLHPRWPDYWIHAVYSQRYRHDVKPVDVTAEGEAFLQSLELTPDRPLYAEGLDAGAAPYQLSVANDAVWVTQPGKATVSRIDLGTKQVTGSVPVGKGPLGIAIGEEAVWVANEQEDTVSRIDPRTMSVVATIAVGKKPAFLTAGFGSVWVTNYASGTVSRIDPRTNAVVATVSVGLKAVGVATGEGAIWVASEANAAVYRIDPETNRIAGRGIPVGASLGQKPLFVAVADGSVWVTTQEGSIGRIDARTNAQVASIGTNGGPLEHVAVGHGAVWAVSKSTGAVWRIDPTLATIVGKPLAFDGWPFALAVGKDGLWITDALAHAVRFYRP